MLDATECPGDRSGDGSDDPNGRRMGMPLVGWRYWLWGRRRWAAGGDDESITVDSRSSSIAASVDRVRLEFFRGIVGARPEGVLACVTRDAREPILLGSSIPPPVSIGPNVGA